MEHDDGDDDDDLVASLLGMCLIFQTLNDLQMEITPAQVIPRLVPANCNVQLICYILGGVIRRPVSMLYSLGAVPFALLEFHAVFALMKRSHYASSEEAFIVTLTKLATGHSNVVLADIFAFSRDGMVSLIYHYMIGVLNNKARGILHACVGCLQQWAHLFPYFSEIIRQKLNML